MQKAWTKSLSAYEVVGNPHKDDKSKAHAVSDVSIRSLNLSLCSHLLKFPTFRMREQ